MHTYGSLVYDATNFCISDANAFTVPSSKKKILFAVAVFQLLMLLCWTASFCLEITIGFFFAGLRMLLRQSQLELLRIIVNDDATQDMIPTDCLRINVANRLIKYARESLSQGAASHAHDRSGLFRS